MAALLAFTRKLGTAQVVPLSPTELANIRAAAAAGQSKATEIGVVQVAAKAPLSEPGRYLGDNVSRRAGAAGAVAGQNGSRHRGDDWPRSANG